MGADLVEEVSVMADNDNGVFKVQQKVLKPVDCGNVKVVCRLVKKKNIGVSEKGLGKENLDLLFAGQLSHEFIVKFVVNTEGVEENFSVAFRTPAVHFRKLFFKLAYSYSVLLGEILFGIKLFLCVHDFNKLCVAHEHGADNIVIVIGIVILLQNGKTLARCDADIALVRLNLTGKDFQKG